MSLKSIASVDKFTLISTPIRDYNLWPLAPSGTLEKPSRTYEVADDSKQHMLDFERSMEYIEKYYQSKSTIMQWYIATIIGILGNIFVTVIFIEYIALYNVIISAFIIILILLVTRIGVNYMPKYSLRYIISSDYEEFPQGYEKYIDIEKINNTVMKAHISMNYLHDILTQYGVFIRNCLIKDALISALKTMKYIKVDKITQLSNFYPSYDISFTTNLYALLHPNNQEDIFNEFMRVNGATLNAKMNSGVYAFELNDNAWKTNGDIALNEIAYISNDFENLNKQLVTEIRNSTNGTFQRVVRKKINTFTEPIKKNFNKRKTRFSDSVREKIAYLRNKFS